MRHNEWKAPFNLAIGFHIALVLGAIYLPKIFHSPPKFPKVYNVTLLDEAAPVLEEIQEPPQVQAPPPPPPKVKPVIPKKVAPIAKPAPQPKAPPVKAISIKPLKRKVKKKVPPKKVDNKEIERQKLLKRQKELRAQEQQRAELARQQAEQARKEAERADQELQKLLQAKLNKPTRPTTSKPVQRQQSSANISAMEGRFLSAVRNRLHSFWTLPEYKNWDPNILAVVVITINRDGRILNHYFEKRSGDRTFDQFVTKTIQEANPLPPIPPVMKLQRREIGLRFRPSGIQ